VTVAISAHRGGSEVAPPATLAAYLDAVAAGAEYVEFDVQRTRDRELVVYHDKQAEMRGVFADRHSRAELGADVLGVAELLTAIAGRAKAHIDVKAPGYEADLVTLALSTVGVGNFVVTGGDAVVATVKTDFPDVRTALSLGRGRHEIPRFRGVPTRWSELRPLRRVRACGADAVAVHYRLANLGVIGVCARNGIGVMVWTVNEPAMIRKCLADDRIDVLITDRPRFALRARAGMS
jgi:glycerophosphoryl diester phosphodiesterase